LLKKSEIRDIQLIRLWDLFLRCRCCSISYFY